MWIIWNAAIAVFHAIPHDLLYCISRIFFTVFEMPSLMIFFTVFLGSLLTFVFFFYSRVISKKKIPPGTFGWPLIGETLDFMGCHHRGSPHEFFHSRTQKYGNLFTTSILGYPTVVFGSPQGSRFLFANENKLVLMSWPRSIVKLFGNSLISVTGDDAKRVRRMLMTFLRPEALQKFVGRLDSITKRHLAEQWIGKNEVTVFPLIKEFAFSVACDLLATINDHDDVERISLHFMELLKGLMQLPIDLPGTLYNKAKHAANAIREQLDGIIGERRIALQEGKASPQQDLLSFLLSNVDHQSEDESLTDDEIKDNFLLLLFAGHDTSTSTLTALLKFLAENPLCYEQVLKEQLEIAGSKEAGQLLEWEDVQKMKYSWRTVQEAMRLMPSAQGGFRNAMQDITYDGYTIPRGWKMYWTVHSTHRKTEYFSNPEKFDPSRFEGAGPPPYTFLPFGGGPRMCPGIEFARMEILVFLHNAVKNFKWTLVDPSEKFTVAPMPAPVNGLPIKLFPH